MSTKSGPQAPPKTVDFSETLEHTLNGALLRLSPGQKKSGEQWIYSPEKQGRVQILNGGKWVRLSFLQLASIIRVCETDPKSRAMVEHYTKLDMARLQKEWETAQQFAKTT